LSAGTKADMNYCCTNTAVQAMLLQMHMLAVAIFLVRNLLLKI
jgi:hypothetical protein